MKICKNIIVITIAFIFLFTNLPIQFINFNESTYVYADMSVPDVDISYDNFANTDNLQLNGDSLIVNDVIQFESGEGVAGESVFTEEKISLGEDFSFSTAFSFSKTPPINENYGYGGFTFTLQTVGNTITANDFHDETIKPSLSIAFFTNYTEFSPVVSVAKYNRGMFLASTQPLGMYGEPTTRAETIVVPYLNGDFNSSTSRMMIDTYFVDYENTRNYNVWIGYDGKNKILDILCIGPDREYKYSSVGVDLAEELIYAGFMGSVGDAGDKSEINNWYFKNDLSLINGAKMAADVAWLTDEMERMEEGPAEDLYLHAEGQYGSTISWESDRTDIVSTDGVVNPPTMEQGNQLVKLTATIKNGSAESTIKIFNIIIKVKSEDIAAADRDWLTDLLLLGGNVDLDLKNVVTDLYLPELGNNGSFISWSSDKANISTWDGSVTRPTFEEGDVEVILTAYIMMGSVILEKQFHITVKALGLSDAEMVDADYLWLTDTIVLSENTALNNVTKDLYLPTYGKYGCNISWSSTDDEVINTSGNVTRPSYSQGSKTVTLIATISRGELTPEREKFFNIKVIALEQSDSEAVDADYLWLTVTQVLDGNSTLDNILTNVRLDKRGQQGSIIGWEITGDTDFVDMDGRVIRPSYTQGDKMVTLTATINKGLASRTKKFTITIKALPQTDEEKIDADGIWLSDALVLNGNAELGSVTMDLFLPTLGEKSESIISWKTTGDTDFVDMDGSITRPLYTQGDKTVTLTATIKNGLALLVKEFVIIIKAFEQTDLERVQDDYLWLSDILVLDGNSALSYVTKNVYLPSLGENGSTISWVITGDTDFVDVDGTITRPTYTQRDKTVTLTATIKRGVATVDKAFTIIVKALEQTDEEKVEDVISWLPGYMASENGDLENVTKNLFLTKYNNNGVTISWASSDTTVVKDNGDVIRPKYTEGDKSVVLTATIQKASVSRTIEFLIIVKAIEQTHLERVQDDYAWLADELVRKDNTSLDNVTENLNLPKIGESESNISWVSSNIEIVDVNGNVTRPVYLQGNKTVTLKATIRSGLDFKVKSFTVTVKRLDITEQVALDEDFKWTMGHHILGDNPSRYSITQDLSYPDSSKHGSIITWTSDKPAVISNSGKVTRPENGRGHEAVAVTLIVSREGMQKTETFKYTVLEKPDITSPKVINTTPENSSTGILWDADKITITYSEDIVRGTLPDMPKNFGIELLSPESAQIAVTIDNNKLTIEPYTHFNSGENILFIPAGAFVDKAGNPTETYELKFNVEEKPIREIEVISSTPQNLERDVDINIGQITFKFNYDDIVEGNSFNGILLRTKAGKVIPTTASLAGNTVTIEFSGALSAETVYEIVIPARTVQDRFLNESNLKIIQFRTIISETYPKIVSVYPVDGQTGIDVKQNIEVVFSEEVKPEDCKLQLTDANGRPEYIAISRMMGNKNGLVIRNYSSRLTYGTTYNLTGPYENEDDSSSEMFSVQFKTGDYSGIVVQSTKPLFNTTDASLNGQIEILFENYVSLERGPASEEIKIIDSQGNAVPYTMGYGINGRVYLNSTTELQPSEIYTVDIPKGTYRNKYHNHLINSSYRFSFATAEKLTLDPQLLEISESWFVGKSISMNASNLTYAVRKAGRSIVSYDWDFGDGTSGTGERPVHTFQNEGIYEITLRIKDSKGVSYEIKKTVRIEPLHNVNMSAGIGSGGNYIYMPEDGARASRVFYVQLEQDGSFVPGESIGVQLYKKGVLERSYPNITAHTGATNYIFVFYPERQDDGTYEIVFTHTQGEKEQIIRQPVIVMNKSLISNTLKFRLYNTNSPYGYFEEAFYLNVEIDGVKTIAFKEWQQSFGYYTYEAWGRFTPYSKCSFEVEGWASDAREIYIGGSESIPSIIKGKPVKPGINSISIDHSASKLKEPNSNLFFEGTGHEKITFDIRGDWKDFKIKYFEFKTDNGRRSFKFHNNPQGDLCKITIMPSGYLKAGEQLMVRAVTENGITSPWEYCPKLKVLPAPIFMGQKLHIYVQDGEYQMLWPTVFDSVMGDSISILKNIPFLGGDSIGLNSDMPEFEGYLDYTDNKPTMLLNFSAGGGYGREKKNTKDTKYKKVKQVTAVGYIFELEIEGGLTFEYDLKTEKWKLNYLVIDMDGYAAKYWSSGYKIGGVIGVTGKVELGVNAGGTLAVDKKSSKTEYSGIIRLGPRVEVSVTGSYGVGDVTGSVTGKIPVEIHIPTGYIGADVDVTAKITASFLTYSTTLYKDSWNAHWDNKKEKLVLRGMLEFTEEGSVEYSQLQLIPRDYGSRQSNWLAGDGAARTMHMLGESDATVANPQMKIMMENIYPNADIQLIQNGDEQWLVWSDDNPERDAINRTQLRYSMLKDGVWSEPIWIDEDGTADFSPSVAQVEQGTLIAWQNIKKVITEEEGLGEMLGSSEISVTDGVYTADGISPNIINLTDDDKLDHSPRLAADGEKALLVWTKSEGLSFSLGPDMDEYLAQKQSDQLLFSIWNDSEWSTPELIEGSLHTVLDSSLAMHGEEGLLLYALDMDDDLSTYEDREVFARVYQENSWNTAIRLTDNLLVDFSPKAVYVNGEWFITWIQDGNIMYKIGLDGEIKTEKFLQNIQSDYQIIGKPGEIPLVALVYKSIGENKAKGLSTSFYDVGNDTWSDEITLTEAKGYEGSFSAMFSEDGKLNVAYSHAEIITEFVPEEIEGVEQLVEQTNINNKVDLQLLTYSPIHDLALLEEDRLFLSTEFPFPSTMTTVYAILRNEGDFAEMAAVEVYDGNPAMGGEKIGETTLKQPIPARSSMEVEIQWLVGSEEKYEYDLYAVVRPNSNIHEANIDNNMINLKVLTADIGISSLTCENVGGDEYLVTTIISNNGSKSLEGIKLCLENENSVETIVTIPIESMKPMQEAVLTYMLSSTDLEKDENGQINMIARVTVPEEIRESFTNNNIRKFSLNPALISVKSINPGQGDVQVDVAAVLSLNFNMSIEENIGFNRISLMDEELNEIAIEKDITNNSLTIIPQNNLEYGTGYTLTVPIDALGDLYGHTMDGIYSLSFTTTTRDPKVIFAYPYEGMEDAKLNTDIRLKFNQNMVQGSNFERIALIESDSSEIPVFVSIDGQHLTINYTGNLKKDTTYSLKIPREAVKNGEGKGLQEDYTLVFTTGIEFDGDSGSGDEGDGGTGSGGDGYIIPETSDVNSYTLEISVDSLVGEGNSDSVRLDSSIGSIIIPSGMLSDILNQKGKTAGITITAADKSKIPEKTRAAIGNHPIIQLTLTIDGQETSWNNPNTPVRVSIPYTPTAEELENTESIVVWYIDTNGNIINIPNGFYNEVDGTVDFNVTHFSYYAVGYNKVKFNDIAVGAWYNKAVSFIAARNITLGTGGGNYSPHEKLTRGQFIVMLMKAYGLEPDENPIDNFADAGNTYYTGYIAAAKRLKISNGVGENLFAPENEISRQEMFTLIYNVLSVMGKLPQGYSGKNITNFTDSEQIAFWARDAMTLLVETGIVKGNDGMLTPMNTSTRAEMAQVIYNLLYKQK